ncbi:MAG: helix-hairpin-helix domain-containing protein [Bacteroidaceae bacterium]|nr:helix-hairpin-helix domain-containing protein [Bacteroidaceae bacterium]
MKNLFKNYFYFRKSDRRVIVTFGCIAVFAIGVLMIVDGRRPSPQPSPVMGRETVQDVGNEPDGLPIVGEMSAEQRGYVSFDPNTVDSLTLIGFGIKPWKVKNFLHYRAAGKVFRSAEDLGDTYGWTAEDVQRLSPYVSVGTAYQKRKETPRFEERKEHKEEGAKPVETKKFHTLTKVDVNEADTSMLRRIPGIGEKISVAIVRYRQRLGGFHSVEQLREISIVSPELLEWFTVSSSAAVQKIHLNKASFQALNSHPYISYEQTKALLQYIRLYGEVKDEETLLATGIFTKEEMEKLRPYIAYE